MCVDAELDGRAQHGDRRVAVLRRPEDAGSGQLHGAVADAGQVQVADAVAAAGQISGCHASPSLLRIGPARRERGAAGPVHPDCRRCRRDSQDPGYPGADGTRIGGRAALTVGRCPVRTHWASTCARAASWCDPADAGTAGDRRAAHAWPAPRGGRDAGRASAPTTTCGWSRGATATRRRRCWTRWRRCSVSTRPRAQYLLSLSAPGPRPPRRPRREVVPAGIRQLLDAVGLPAFVESRIFDVLAANRLATALAATPSGPAQNRLRSVFLDEGERDCTRNGSRRSAAWSPRSARRSARDIERSADRAAGRRAVAGQRAVPPALGPARRQGAGRLAGADPPPQVGMLELRREKLRSATRAASCW